MVTRVMGGVYYLPGILFNIRDCYYRYRVALKFLASYFHCYLWYCLNMKKLLIAIITFLYVNSGNVDAPVMEHFRVAQITGNTHAATPKKGDMVLEKTNKSSRQNDRRQNAD